MTTIKALFILTTAVILFHSSCRKDGDGHAGNNTPIGHLELSVDSACIQAPNVFTPVPDDGINSVFAVLTKNIDSIQVRITNSIGQVVHTSSDLNDFWDGSDPTGTGPYTVQVNAVTHSGVALNGFGPLYVLAYDSASCLTFSGTPVCGDQLDPRICGVTYPTNELFCN